ncbi:histidine phosphatase family protein [Pararobbsia silviterrae]|uniref:Histidine phosphatase family protein n=1 Tax=Pararobbsia silviterrae TaxID=1792498 RepID=A0A494Y124_9BURK|nr:histidine phosphatase family protein [Pararobbsia silviterrae]RKP55939.1 histidine phosphatase family protein [Pararobbsia silviterrae]
MGQLFLVRHGQASFGAADYDRLSALGVTQADLLGRWFKSCALPADRIVAGAMRRHRETAEHCMAAFDAEAVPRIEALAIDARLNEFDHAHVMDVYRARLAVEALQTVEAGGGADADRRAAAALSSAELERQFALAMGRWMGGEHDADYEESWTQFRGRCIAAFEALTDGSHPSKHIVVFTSGGVIAAICQHVLDLTNKATRELNWSLANTGVTRLLFTKGRRGFGYLNSTAHVEWAREPAWLTYR